jgi:DNA-directed RNA polymerase specialized sigma24 family protein
MTKDWFAQEYETGRLRTVNFLISKGMARHAAEEIAQAAWVRGWECRGQLRDLQKALAWVNSIALNMGRNDQRHSARLTGETDVVADSPMHQLAVLDVQRKLALCRPGDRTLLRKHYWEECSIAELAEWEHCSKGAMRLRLLRARRSLRRLFEIKNCKTVKRDIPPYRVQTGAA